jgi:hypothetical protein
MRKSLDLSATELPDFMMLLHGPFGGGKTYFVGDMLAHEGRNGNVRYLNLAGEDGYLTLKSMGLGSIGETAETFKDVQDVITDYAKAGLQALGVDSLKHLARLIILHHCPDGMPKVGGSSNDWQKIHRDFEQTVAKLRWLATYVCCTSPSDRSMDQISQETYLTPDLPGRQAAGVAGQFDFVFMLQTKVIGKQVRRELLTQPQNNVVIRQRLPKPLPSPIVLPEGAGGWVMVKDLIREAITT